MSFSDEMEGSAVERIWHIQDSQGQILALSMQESLKPFELFSLRSEAVGERFFICMGLGAIFEPNSLLGA